MKIVGAGFRDDIDHRSRVAAVFGVERVGENTELLNGVRRRLDRGAVGEDIVAVATVDRVIVRAAAASVDGNDARIVAPVEEIGAHLRLHAGLQLKEFISVARA